MRPEHLTLEGFASFRTRTEIDFSGSDYFALVGPTGSGKSTILDGIVFALYGTAPRWGGTTVVKYALAPTSIRATVQLVFEHGGQRYRVAREVRRTGRALGLKAASLDRFDAAVPDDVEVLAQDGQVTKAVTALLGIGLEEFCTSVVLPQGQFAEFLVATPKQRQEILLKLIGAGRYEAIRRQAGVRQREAHDRRVGLEGRLAQVADATAEAVAAAGSRAEALAVLGETTRALTAELTGHDDAIARAVSAEKAASDRQALLSEVTVPPGVVELQEQADAVTEAVTAARQAESAAGRRTEEARTALAGAGSRSEWELLRDRWARHDELSTGLPGLTGLREEHAEDARQANQAADSAREAWVAATRGLDEARSALASARDRLVTVTADRAGLTQVEIPAEVEDLAARLAFADSAVGAAELAVKEAEHAERAARRARDEAGDEPALLQTAREMERLSGLRADEAAQRATESDAMRSAEHCERSRDAAITAFRTAQQALDRARDRHIAAGLRSHLVVGDECPVCTQPVASLPAPLPADELVQAERAATTARENEEEARRQHDEAQRALIAATTTRRHTSDAADALAASLGVGPADDLTDLRAAVAADLARIERARRRLEAAESAAVEARDRFAGASDERNRLAGEADSSRAELHDARERLVPLGAPRIDAAALGDAWRALAAWAAGAIAIIDDATLPAATGEVDAAANAEQAAADAAHRAEQDWKQAEATRTACAEQAVRSSAAADRAEADLAALSAVLADAPASAETDRRLRELDALEADERQAFAAWREATGRVASAVAEQDCFARRREAAVETLRAIRQALAALDPPPVDEADLAGAWAAVARWSRTAASRADDDVVRAAAGVSAARQARSRTVDDLLAALEAADVDCPDPAQSSSVVAGELARANQRHEDLARTHRTRLALEADMEAAEHAEQVAELLATHLRSDRFQRWLATEALDVLVARASESLDELSGGQFGLTHDAGEFFVIDHADAESRRSVRTLSGGETFQASLALALALSSELSAFSAGNARLQSIFLDEGFGTLDAESLEVVAGTLEQLANSERMVGIVTHVPGLAERVPTRFVVSRDSTSSRVRRHG